MLIKANTYDVGFFVLKNNSIFEFVQKVNLHEKFIFEY